MKAVIGLLVCGVGLLTNIVGIALPFWRYYGIGESSAYFGLWVNCVNLKILTASVQECAGFSNEVIDEKLRAVRALEIIGMIGMAVAVVCVLLKMTRMRENDRLPIVTGVVAIVSGILMIIGCIIFSTWDAFSTNARQRIFRLKNLDGRKTRDVRRRMFTIDDKLRAVRALEIIGMLGMAAAVVCVLLKMTKMRENDRLPKVAGVVAIVSGILMIIGCIIFSTWGDVPKEFMLHAGFALCIVAGIISISAGVCNFLLQNN